jgi:CBS domain-containing protein
VTHYGGRPGRPATESVWPVATRVAGATMKIREVMTPAPVAVVSSDTVTVAAMVMKQQDIGAVLVTTDGQLTGILTDRDIAVRVLAAGADPSVTTVSEVCSPRPATVGLDDETGDAIRLMRTRAVRRVPVTDNGVPVGIVSIGDLALTSDQQSALADISLAPPNG